MSINKNEMTADEIDAILCEAFCDNCSESGNCAGCKIIAAVESARKLTTLALDAACAECGGGHLHKEGCSRELAFFESPRK